MVDYCLWIWKFNIIFDYQLERVTLSFILRELDKLESQKKYIIIGIVATMQLSLYLFYKFVFFSYVSEP